MDRKGGKSLVMLHGLKAPHDAIRLGDGSILVNEFGTKSLVQLSGDVRVIFTMHQLLRSVQMAWDYGLLREQRRAKAVDSVVTDSATDRIGS